MVEKKTPFYKTNCNYSITINLDDKHQGKLNKSSRTKLIYAKTIISSFFDNFKDIRILLHLDISEPREINKNSPRIHFHGCINFKTNEAICDFLLIVAPKLSAIAYTQIDTIENIKLWESYCKKYDHITSIVPISQGLEWNPID